MKEKEVNTGLPKERAINLSDFAFFLAVMQNKDAYESVLSIILEEEDLELKEVKVEQVILNKSGKRAIRLDAWALDHKNRQINTEMQNDTEQGDIRKRARFYQGLMDSPVLKSGRRTKYKHLPSTIIIFITQEDIFGKNCAKYTFTEQCEEIDGLHLEDGTKKIFLNMSSKNGAPELVSLLQYMKETRIDNPEIIVHNKRIEKLDSIVSEVKQSEEWEDVRMSIMKYALEHGTAIGIEQGLQQGIVELICKKLKKNKTREQIADEVEEELDRIDYLCDLAIAENYDVKRICDKLTAQKK